MYNKYYFKDMSLKSKRFLLILISVIFFSTEDAVSQQPLVVDQQIVESVEKDIWTPFMESYRDLDLEKFKSLHADDFVRVSVDFNEIESKSKYFETVAYFFEQLEKAGMQMDISFAILTSATTQDKVYQTGYYVISVKPKGTDNFIPQGYSFFSVLLNKGQEDGTWKIALDSDKQVELTQEEFLKAGTIYKLK